MRRVLLAAFSVVLVVGSATASRGIDWQPLHRPLHLPALARGAKCPVSREARGIIGERYGVSGAIGPGPVYAMLGGSAFLMVSPRPEEWGPGPWRGQKVLWFVHPRYRGPVLIRGRRLDGPEWMRFDRGSRPPAEIRIAPGETVTWTGQPPGSRGRPSYVRVRAPGCYAAQIDGTTFSNVIVFVIDMSA